MRLPFALPLITLLAGCASMEGARTHGDRPVPFASPPRAMTFLGISNREKSVAFYRDILGLVLIADHGQAIIFNAHGTELRLTFPPKVQPAGYTVFGLAVRDIDASVLALGAKGVIFERYGFAGQAENGVMNFPNGDKVAWFKDPDGNLLSLTEFPATRR